MLHIRLVVPSGLVDAVLELLRDAAEVTNVWHMAGAAVKPPGDLVSFDVAKEEGSAVVTRLRDLGLAEDGSIAIELVDASISRVAADAERAAPGSPADAVVWEEVEGRVSESATLSVSFLAFMSLAAMIAAIGIITDSIVLIIGAMVVGPEFGPLAGLCVAAAQRRSAPAGRSILALGVGFPLAIGVSTLLTLLLIAGDLAPSSLNASDHELTLFIARPNWYSAIVALCAGAAGMLAVVSAKSGALIGVLISVTTIPAAANVAVAAAYGNWTEAGGAAAQLAINVAAILSSGYIVLMLEQRSTRRRSARTVSTT